MEDLYFYVDNKEWQPKIAVYKLGVDHPLGKQIDLIFEKDWENKGTYRFYGKHGSGTKMTTIDKDYLKEHGKKLEGNKEEFFDSLFDILGRK